MMAPSWRLAGLPIAGRLSNAIPRLRPEHSAAHLMSPAPWALLRRRLEELQPVAEWVMRVHAPEAGEVSVPADVLAGFDQSVNHVVKIGDHNARVALAGWLEIVFDPEVQFDVACSEPRATACCEDGRLVDLGHAEDADEEVARGTLLGSRHCQLHVVEPIEGHATDLASTWIHRITFLSC